MSRKNKNFRAWKHQNPDGTVEDAWDAAWASQQGKAYSLRIKELEDKLAEFEFQDVEYYGSDYRTEVYVYHGPATEGE